MTEYICKCGRKLQRSTQSETTGNKLDGYAPGHECFGCPYVIPITRFENGHFVPDHYECVASKALRYETYAGLFSFDRDSTDGHILSLDFDFLRRVAAECDKHEAAISLNREKDGQMFHYKSKYRPDGRFDFTIYPTQNKAGANAKRAIFEKFFTDGGARKDLTPEQEKEKILNDIQEGRRSGLPQPYIPGDVYIDPGDHSRMRVVDVTPDKKERTWQVQSDDGDGWEPANGSVYPHLHDAVATLGAFVRDYGLIPDQESNDPPEVSPTFSAAATAAAEEPVSPPAEQAPANTTAEPAAAGSEPEERALAEHPVTSELPQRPGDVFKAPNGTLYKIADKLIGKQRCWHTVRFNPSTCEWLAVNSTVYDNLENALGEFAAWIRTENMKPVARNGAAAVTTDANAVKSENAVETQTTPADAATSPAPACPAECGTAEPALTAPSPASLAAASTTDMAGQPYFDYSVLSQKTIDTMRLAEEEIRDAKRVYISRVSNAVAMVHHELVANCDELHHNQHSDNTFLAWCLHVGISKHAAYRFLQVDRLLSSARPDELATLETAKPSLLYAAAKPSADPDMVQDLKDGKISTLKEWNQREAELKAQLKAKSDELAAEKSRADSLSAEIGAREEKISELLEASEQADQRANQAETRIKGLEDSYRSAHANEEFAIRRAADAEARAKHAEQKAAELEARPIEVAVQQPSDADLARWRAEGAEQARRESAASIASADAARKKAEDRIKKLQETLQGRTDHLNAVETELAQLKAQLKTAPSSKTAPGCAPACIPCTECAYEDSCCGLSFFGDIPEEDDAINARLTGCTAGKRKGRPA